jgi:peroxiredoxin
LLLLCSLVCVPSGPAFAQRLDDFGSPPALDVVAPPFEDAEIDSLIGLLAERIAVPGNARPSVAGSILTGFVRRLQAGRLAEAHEMRVHTALEGIGLTHPALARLAGQASRMVRDLTVGKVAPDIAGRDLEGAPLRLSDYRGKVVVVSFSGEWCGICRSEYPYQRLLLDLYRDWPFALLSVESGRDPAAAKSAKVAQRLEHPSFWDSGGADPRSGAIANAWHVTGWPTVYVLDARGVIRFVDVRKEDLLRAVRQLMTERIDEELKRKSEARSQKPEVKPESQKLNQLLASDF